jgi:hypothetical protein
MKPIYETLMAERNRDNPDEYRAFEVQRDIESGRVFFESDRPIYALIRHEFPDELAETLRWMADEVEKIGKDTA